MRYDIATQKTLEATAEAATTVEWAWTRRRLAAAPARGRQFEYAIAPAGNHRAIYRDRNVWIADSSGANAVQITTDGSVESRIKYGTASWVYGEELSQRTAMWWSPDGKKLAYYRFDESRVPDFYLATNLTRIQDTLDIEAYPKPGVPNPAVDLFIYDVDSRKTTRVDVRDGKPFENAAVGYYVFRVDWSPGGKELTFLRTNRRQNTMEMAACNPDSGELPRRHPRRVAYRLDRRRPRAERLLAQATATGSSGSRTAAASRTTICTISRAAKLITPITQLPAEVVSIVRVDEPTNTMYYIARDGDNYMKLQLHRVGLDGKNDRRLTDPAFTHTISLSPDAKHFVDVAETHDQPPVTRLVDANGKVVAELAKADLTKFNELGLKKVEMYTYKTSDGLATLHGIIQLPVELRSEQEVSGARQRVRRASGRKQHERAVPDPERHRPSTASSCSTSRRARIPAWAASISTRCTSSSARRSRTTWRTA